MTPPDDAARCQTAAARRSTATDIGGARSETQAPIFEFRRMIGFVDHRLWATLALELFDDLVAVNRQTAVVTCLR